jgi:uncharacterized protein GlcG (DUF336 family)
MTRKLIVAVGTLVSVLIASSANVRAERVDCAALPTYTALVAALKGAVKPAGGPSNGGLDFNMWGSLVAVDGTVCAVAFTGKAFTDQWLGSRVISAQKANTANAFSLDGFALSTANLYAATQPGGSLFGLQASNPVDTAVAYGGREKAFGMPRDPMVGQRIGGVNVFGGGLALYKDGKKIGALGVSGDTSCADHNIAWRVRKALQLDKVPAGVSPNKDDGIVYDIAGGVSKGGFGHVTCGGKEADVAKEIGAGAVVQ